MKKVCAECRYCGIDSKGNPYCSYHEKNVKTDGKCSDFEES